jgi:predicted glycogen debranching enzyme
MIQCKDLPFEELAGSEWLVTNGLGGYAASTLCGANTSRYHGLLIAATNPPVDRKMLVSKVEEIIIHEQKEYALSVNQYPDVLYPKGFQHLISFERCPLPQMIYQTPKLQLSKIVFMVHDSNTTVVEYKNQSEHTFKLCLNPLYTYRDFHKITGENNSAHYAFEQKGRLLRIQPEEKAEVLYFRFSAGHFTERRAWNKNIQYESDKKRGTEFTEDYYSLGFLEHELQAGESLFLLFSLDLNCRTFDPQQLKEEEIKRLSRLSNREGYHPFYQDLLRASDQFLVTRASTQSASVIAGYYWFSDWGRDTMIALRGLCIAQGKGEEARSVLLTFLTYLQDGLLPNRFPDHEGDETEYNTADASLWLFVAIYEYHLKFKDLEFIESVLPELAQILSKYIQGTKHEIRVQENGLLHCGHKQIQVTWMDAKLGDSIFTSRHGLAVEINALWYNALMIYQELCGACGREAEKGYRKLSQRVRKNFCTVFWNEKNYLNDVVLDHVADMAIRPNQIYALSLPFRLLSLEKEKKVLKCIEEHLLTPYGLRTLSPLHPDFKPRYEGSWFERDAAYHQGTVWPFLLPEFLLAARRIDPRRYTPEKIYKLLSALENHFYHHNCVHAISEVFDGMQPSKGKGCVQQAWSVANLILLLNKMSETDSNNLP